MTPAKVSVTVAPTGGLLTKAQHSQLPTQPGEIAGEAVATSICD